MKYFEAYEITTRPFILFRLIAQNEADLTPAQEASLIVVSEENLPSYEFGICHKKIFNNELIDRPQVEIDEYEAKSIKAVNLYESVQKGEEVKAATFAFDGHEFPMTFAADQIYRALEYTLGTGSFVPKNIASTTGDYEIIDANVEDFIAAYYTAIYDLT